MAFTKTLVLIATIMCIFSTAQASVMLEKWIAVFEKTPANDDTWNRLMKVMLW